MDEEDEISEIEDALAPARRFAGRWFYLRDSRIYGPFRHGELESMLAEGKLGPLTLLARDGGGGWHAAPSWPEFEGLFPEFAGRRRANDGELLQYHLDAVRQRAVRLFLLFLAMTLMVAGHVTALLLRARNPTPGSFCCCGFVWLVAGIIGAFYALSMLRRSWRLLAMLSLRIAVCGFIAAIGLPVILVVGVLLVVLRVIHVLSFA